MQQHDYTLLSENVAGHTMMSFHTHEDGRSCMFHSRLGKWTFEDLYECLRTHDRRVSS